MQVREFVCVTCPVGCTIQAKIEDGQLVEAEGQGCKRGVAFVREELTAPRRMITTTIQVKGGQLPLVPVRSSMPVPKDKLLAIADVLRSIELRAPVVEHQIVMQDVLGTGVDIITSRSMPEAAA